MIAFFLSWLLCVLWLLWLLWLLCQHCVNTASCLLPIHATTHMILFLWCLLPLCPFFHSSMLPTGLATHVERRRKRGSGVWSKFDDPVAGGTKGVLPPRVVRVSRFVFLCFSFFSLFIDPLTDTVRFLGRTPSWRVGR